MSRRKKAPEKPTIRCAIYTRKSSEEGLDQEFNSLDAQREAAEAYIASQKAQGWVALPTRYDDGGFSGGSMERPGLEQLLRDIEAGDVDCVVVYKVDRLSRSLLDFSRIMETFDKQGVSFVSVTQQFNTTNSMGRLTLNVLLSFAQFEREIIGERIRDKIAAQKRKGKWAGGVPVLGYDVDRSGPSPKLVVNAREAARVRKMFELYLEKGSLLPLLEEVNRRGWVTKERVTKKGKTVGGHPFNKATLYRLLTNPILVGKIVHKGDIYDGEHEAIVDAEVFDEVRARLSQNGRGGSVEARNKYGALLRGLLRCKACDCAMTHTFASGRNKRQYRYYRCVNAIKSGRQACPTGTLPAPEIEAVVVDEVRALATDKELLAEVLEEAQSAVGKQAEGLQRERDDLRCEMARHDKEMRSLVAEANRSPEATARLADLTARLTDAEKRVSELDAQLAEAEHERISPQEAAAAFADFGALWASLAPREQARLLKLLISTVEYDAENGAVSITFRPTSIRALLNRSMEEAA